MRLTKKIFKGTLLVESIGAIILSVKFIPQMGIVEGIYNSIFHSISAFCNSGFDIMGKYGEYSSLIHFSNDIVVLSTISALIVIGGIGFFIWNDLSKHALRFKRYSLHTKVVLITTLILIVIGTTALYFFEKDNLLLNMSTDEKIMVSLFNAITPRTAGFSAVNTNSMTSASKLLTAILMFIGGSPGSTAGGIKTTTLVVVLISVHSTLFNKKNNNIFGRRLEDNDVKKATAIISVNLTLIVLSALIISATNTGISISDIVFEVVSAIGTVGLSTGITSELNSTARAILILLMYCGRVGSLSLAMVFTDNKSPSPVKYPVEKISVG